MATHPPAPTADRLLDLVDAMAGQSVAMLVDLVADRFVTGTPKRISREAPVLILRYEGEILTPGGGANAVANVAALDGRPLTLGVVGDDEPGRELLDVFAARGIATDGILTRTGYRTPTKVRILGGARGSVKQQIVRYDVEDILDLDDDQCRTLLDGLRSRAADVRAAVVSDYGYGAAPPHLLAPLRRILAPGCPILGDSRFRLHQLRGLDAATPNAEEAEALLGRPLDGDDEAGGRELLGALGTRFLVITRGSAGMSFFVADGPSAHLPVHGTAQVADVTGAGDTVIATVALALAAGATPLEAACLANYAGGVVVMKMGTATLSRGELRAAIEHDPKPLREIRWGG